MSNGQTIDSFLGTVYYNPMRTKMNQNLELISVRTWSESLPATPKKSSYMALTQCNTIYIYILNL